MCIRDSIHISCIICVGENLEELLQREIEDAKTIATKGRVLKLPPPQKRRYRITITVVKYK